MNLTHLIREKANQPKDLVMRQSLVRAAAEKYQQKLMKDALGMTTEKQFTDLERKKVYQENIEGIKKELKQSMRKTYGSGIGEIIARIEIIGDLFQELEHTLTDLDKEKVDKDKFTQIQRNSEDYQDLLQQQLRDLRAD